jgi:hypothetical protein
MGVATGVVSRAGAGALAGALVAAAVAAAEPGVDAAPADRAAFERVYERLAVDLRESPFGEPLLVEASVDDDTVVQGDVFSVIEHPFERVSRVLGTAEAWCDILTLHHNVKSCREAAAGTEPAAGVALEIETARKYYVPPQGRTPRTYQLDASGSRPELLRAALRAERGPFGVRDMSLEIFGMAAEPGRSFLHLRYAYSPGFFTRAATRTFLATVGRGKIGFTVTGRDEDGEPIYVGGVQGAVERNAMRYHLAVVAYLDTLAVPEDERFERRIARWFELTERYSEQLFEMSRDDYLQTKRRERSDQQAARQR